MSMLFTCFAFFKRGGDGMGMEVCIATKDNNTIVQRQFHAPVTHTCIFFSKFTKIRRECIKNHIYFIFSLDHLSYYTISVEDANVEMIPMSKLASFR